MSSGLPLPFTLLDSPHDASFVLVLIEASRDILNYWDDVRAHYLPILLDAVQAGNRNRPVRRSLRYWVALAI